MSLNSLILTLIFILFLFDYLDTHFGVESYRGEDCADYPRRQFAPTGGTLDTLLTDLSCDENGIVAECTDLDTDTSYYLVLIEKGMYDKTIEDWEAESLEEDQPQEEKEKRTE